MTRLADPNDGLLWTKEDHTEWFLVPGEDHWLFLYARAVCATLNFTGHKLKGRGHDPRFEVREDLFERMLPHFHIHPPTGTASVQDHRCPKGKQKLEFGNVRCALEHHRDLLQIHLLAAGYDMERGRLVCEDAYFVAKAHWMLNREPMPKPLLDQQLSAVRTKLRTLDRHEDADLFQTLQS